MSARLVPLRVALVALAALAGLFAMHGLTHHGEHLPSHGGTAHHASGHDSASPVESPVATADASPVEEPSMGGAAAAMCLAIVLTGLLAGIAVRRPRRGLLLRLPPAATLALPGPRATRSHDPPDRWALAVCRC